MNSRSLSQRLRASYGVGNYRGVIWHKTHKKWMVSLKVDGKNKHIGNFENEEDGRIAINKAYKKHFPNNPELHQEPSNKKLAKLNDMTSMQW